MQVPATGYFELDQRKENNVPFVSPYDDSFHFAVRIQAHIEVPDDIHESKIRSYLRSELQDMAHNLLKDTKGIEDAVNNLEWEIQYGDEVDFEEEGAWINDEEVSHFIF